MCEKGLKTVPHEGAVMYREDLFNVRERDYISFKKPDDEVPVLIQADYLTAARVWYRNMRIFAEYELAVTIKVMTVANKVIAKGNPNPHHLVGLIPQYHSKIQYFYDKMSKFLRSSQVVAEKVLYPTNKPFFDELKSGLLKKAVQLIDALMGQRKIADLEPKEIWVTTNFFFLFFSP